MNSRGRHPALFEDPNLLAEVIIERVGNRIELARVTAALVRGALLQAPLLPGEISAVASYGTTAG